MIAIVISGGGDHAIIRDGQLLAGPFGWIIQGNPEAVFERGNAGHNPIIRVLSQRCLGSIGFCSFHNEIPDVSILEQVNVLRWNISDDEVLGLPVRIIDGVIRDVRVDGERTDRVQLDKLVIPLNVLRQGDLLSLQRQ